MGIPDKPMETVGDLTNLYNEIRNGRGFSNVSLKYLQELSMKKKEIVDAIQKAQEITKGKIDISVNTELPEEAKKLVLELKKWLETQKQISV